MEKLDGMALAAALKQRPDAPDVVFISTDRDMAMQGYRVEARRYLPKPLEPELLREALLHCYGEARRRTKGRDQLMLPTASGRTRISLHDIRYAETWGRGTRISLPSGQLELRMRLSELVSQLPGVVRVLPPDGFGQSGLCQRHLSRNAGAPGRRDSARQPASVWRKSSKSCWSSSGTDGERQACTR